MSKYFIPVLSPTSSLNKSSSQTISLHQLVYVFTSLSLCSVFTPLGTSSLWQLLETYWSFKVSEVAQSCPTLCDPMDCSPPGFSVHGILQARILEWVASSFSRGSSRPRDQTQVSHIAGRCFNLWATKPSQISTTLWMVFLIFPIKPTVLQMWDIHFPEQSVLQQY